MAVLVGERCARALAERYAVGVKALLRSDVDSRAMTPGKSWEATDVDTIVDETILGTWFTPEQRITDVLAIETDRVGPLDRVGYRCNVPGPDGEIVIEQQAYFETDAETISWIRIMCSGFLPLA